VVNYQMGLEGGGGGSLQTMLVGMTEPMQLSGGVDRADPFLLGGEPAGGAREEDRPMKDAYFDAALDSWIGPFIMQGVNPLAVRRSSALLEYGSQFNYREVTACRNEEEAQRSVKFVNAPARPEELRRMIEEGKLPQPGEGPSPEARALARFQSTLVACNEAGESVTVTVTGAEVAYEETAKMAVEAGLALVYEGASCPGVVSGGGFLTPAACMGTVLIQRLHRAGIRFDVVSDAARRPAAEYAGEAIARFWAAEE